MRELFFYLGAFNVFGACMSDVRWVIALNAVGAFMCLARIIIWGDK